MSCTFEYDELNGIHAQVNILQFNLLLFLEKITRHGVKLSLETVNIIWKNLLTFDVIGEKRTAVSKQQKQRNEIG